MILDMEFEEIASEMDVEFEESLSIGGGNIVPSNPIIQKLDVVKNGTYTAPDGVDGYSPVTVNVPIPDGYIQPSGTKDIISNGEYDVTDKAKVLVAVPDREVLLQNIEVTENGSYTAAEATMG